MVSAVMTLQVLGISWEAILSFWLVGTLQSGGSGLASFPSTPNLAHSQCGEVGIDLGLRLTPLSSLPLDVAESVSSQTQGQRDAQIEGIKAGTSRELRT